MKMGVCRERRRTLRLRHSPAPMQKNVSRGGELRPLQQPTKRMKTRRPPYLSKHLVMSTGNLGEAQSVTSRLWSKHRSRVAGNKGYSANLSRCPLGRSWLCYIDCRAPMHVEPGQYDQVLRLSSVGRLDENFRAGRAIFGAAGRILFSPCCHGACF